MFYFPKQLDRETVLLIENNPQARLIWADEQHFASTGTMSPPSTYFTRKRGGNLQSELRVSRDHQAGVWVRQLVKMGGFDSVSVFQFFVDAVRGDHEISIDLGLSSGKVTIPLDNQPIKEGWS